MPSEYVYDAGTIYLRSQLKLSRRLIIKHWVTATPPPPPHTRTHALTHTPAYAERFYFPWLLDPRPLTADISSTEAFFAKTHVTQSKAEKNFISYANSKKSKRVLQRQNWNNDGSLVYANILRFWMQTTSITSTFCYCRAQFCRSNQFLTAIVDFVTLKWFARNPSFGGCLINARRRQLKTVKTSFVKTFVVKLLQTYHRDTNSFQL